MTTQISYTSYEQLKDKPPIADIYCVGSDQVWNSDWNGGIDRAFYLDYVPKTKRRIAFASSFGMDMISKEEQSEILNYLSNFTLISVREKSAVNILKEMNILDVRWILDPTLLITKQQWSKFLGKTKNKKYILVYQLNNNDFFDNVVEKIAKITSLKVIRLEYKRTKKYGQHVVLPSVSEWLTYFYNAEYVITDSFHATAFSINFEKQFIDILPEKFGTRIISILELLGLQERRIDSIDEMKILLDQIDYAEVNQKLKKEQIQIRKLFEKMEIKYDYKD